MNRTNRKTYLIALISIAILNILTALIDGKLNKWGTTSPQLQKFLGTETLAQKFSPYFIVFAALLFIIWTVYVNGKIKAMQRFLIHTILFMLYFILVGASVLFFSLGAEIIADWLNVKFTQIINTTAIIVAFAVCTTLCNYLIARLEGLKIGKKHFIILLITVLAIPLFCFVWFKLLNIFLPELFAENILLNGSFIFAFILYEGSFYLWLKSMRTFQFERRRSV